MRIATVVLVLALAASACGDDDGDGDGEDASGAVASDASTAVEDGDGGGSDVDDGTDAIDDLADSLEDQQAAEGGGSASLTVGGETYTFDSVLCAFGPEEIGQEGAEFVMSSIQNGTQLYFSIDQFGHKVTLDDIEDFENPSVSWDSRGEDFIVVDGQSASGEAGFVDGTTDSFEELPGSFQASCP